MAENTWKIDGGVRYFSHGRWQVTVFPDSPTIPRIDGPHDIEMVVACSSDIEEHNENYRDVPDYVIPQRIVSEVSAFFASRR